MEEVIALLWPALALAFSGAPAKGCKEDAYCVLVRESYCGEVSAIALGNDQAWADWDAKLREKDAKAGRKCAGARPDPRAYEARCLKNECVAVKKGG